MPDKPTSEQLRREAEKLRETGDPISWSTALLITKSVELEKLIAGKEKPKKISKIAHYQSTVSRRPSALRQNSHAIFQRQVSI